MGDRSFFPMHVYEFRQQFLPHPCHVNDEEVDNLLSLMFHNRHEFLVTVVDRDVVIAYVEPDSLVAAFCGERCSEVEQPSILGTQAFQIIQGFTDPLDGCSPQPEFLNDSDFQKISEGEADRMPGLRLAIR
jgi:hypothetical protein